MENLVIIDPDSGLEINIPVSEFSEHGYLDAIINERHKEINLVALIRVIQEKAKAKFSKKEFIQLKVLDKQIDIQVPMLAKSALFSYTNEEIATLFTDPMLSNDLDKAVSASLPSDIQPSTSAQRSLAMRIAEVLDIELGYEIIASKEKIGAFISQNQFELDSYERDIEGYEVVSERMCEALLLYLGGNSAWACSFNIAFELYLQLAQRGKELVAKLINNGVSDRFWNDNNDKPEGQVCSLVIQEMGLRHNRTTSFSIQFEKKHRENIYT